MFGECVKIKWGKRKYLEIKKLVWKKKMYLIGFELITINLLRKALTNYSTSILCYFNMIF